MRKNIAAILAVFLLTTWVLDNSDDNFQTTMPKIVVFFGFR